MQNNNPYTNLNFGQRRPAPPTYNLQQYNARESSLRQE
jgi:hypothetical protein